jgi:hypothetical protein
MADSTQIDSTVDAVAGACNASELSAAESERLAGELAGLGLFEGVQSVEVVTALRLEGTGARAALYAVCIPRGEVAGQVGPVGAIGVGEPRQLIRADLGKDLGRVFMRRESLGDKISEVYNEIEVDFTDHPVFSDRYYVLADDEARFRAGVNGMVLEAIGAVDDLVVEINGSTLTAFCETGITDEGALELARLALVAASAR